MANSSELFQKWIETNVDGAEVDELFGMKVPCNIEKVSILYDTSFTRFASLVAVGKKKFANGNVLNTATTKDDLVLHASIVAPYFVKFMNEFLETTENVEMTCGSENKNLIKSGDGLDFKLKWEEPAKIHDMIRTAIICPSIKTLENTIQKFITFC